MMARSKRSDDLVRDLLDGLTIRAKSLIVTIFGDAIAPHGGTVWLGSLIELVKPFDLSERLVRTAALRLAKDGWLTWQMVGRRSYYSLTESGRRRFDDAHRRIYAPPRQGWDGRWRLVLSDFGLTDPGQRETLRRELGWMGFGALAPGVAIHPTVDLDAVRHVLQDLDLIDRVVILTAATDDLAQRPPLPALVRGCWDLERLAEDYAGFLARFRPAFHALDGRDDLDPELCLILRILVIHEYRRLLLRDPQLPEELLPADWAGSAARLLTRNIYRLCEAAAETHLMATLRTLDGPLPEAAPYYHARFGGLRDAAHAGSSTA